MSADQGGISDPFHDGGQRKGSRCRPRKANHPNHEFIIFHLLHHGLTAMPFKSSLPLYVVLYLCKFTIHKFEEPNAV